MPRINRTKYAILGVLTLRPRTGYDIKKFCDNHLSFIWSENYGQIYPVLKQLEDEDLVIKQTEYIEGKPSKNIYTITEKGRASLNEWVQLPEEPITFRSELLLKLFFGSEVPLSSIIEKLERKRESEIRTLDHQEGIRQLLESKLKDRNETDLWWVIFRHGQLLSRATIAWCEESIRFLQEKDRQQRVD